MGVISTAKKNQRKVKTTTLKHCKHKSVNGKTAHGSNESSAIESRLELKPKYHNQGYQFFIKDDLIWLLIWPDSARKIKPHCIKCGRNVNGTFRADTDFLSVYHALNSRFHQGEKTLMDRIVRYATKLEN